MFVPFISEIPAEHGYVSLFPDGLQALAILSSAVTQYRVEHPVVAAAGRDIRVDDNLFAVPPAHFFAANSLPSAAFN
jgi:hypothetical protein